ncbi:M2 family metallopeptidase [Anaerocellum danielii]|uniref:M2 family metallopeptidase n=1 Tax=Anaerocellum danielii TaxID=1387557 RepID=A0ABZ0TZB0_9FIRM|nr:M2 family metallopeptidase [Caldicellulosiruptor danielii]WPX08799.1 M2 family metallopeptidase [Caldicellulosiruptor danielii]
MSGWLDEAMRTVKNGDELLWMPEQIFYDSVAVAMKKI